ncbi:hypothetical protein [Pseudohoeflea coraliihabitans]|uniref:Uncharacterized protein n=1 Tax=Pseudohoeflea coraliihabitans TaxID=2860393 RepID=A0ABS6WRS7_9HYPH|nr:hypothetical protein [Pseudohoeflea sp. DP4N28-3]MBW3098112.1 hypothetical protein [Pseudohoeflea sp. DP4N28-3]
MMPIRFCLRSGQPILAALILATGAPAALRAESAHQTAAPDCQCVTKGQRVALGSIVCLEIGPGNRYLARCERVLNNTSWKRLQDGCPTAMRGSLRGYRLADRL